MHYKNPNLNLPTKNDVDRKSPLKLRPNIAVNPANSGAFVRNYSNTLPGGPKLEDPSQLTQLPVQNIPPNTNPLQSAFGFSNGPSLSLPLSQNPLNQSGPIISQTNHSSFIHTSPQQNSTGNLQTLSAFNAKPMNFVSSEFFNGQPKESNLSSLSRGYTVNEASRFHSNAQQSNVITRPSDLNDNLSYQSKLSTNSRNNVLRAISVNNEDHLMNLTTKEDLIKNQNILIANNFLQSIESSKRNVRRNMTENFRARVHEIWTSYLAEQLKTSPRNLDVNSLDGDIEQIKQVFLDSLLTKTDLYVEQLRNATLNKIFAEIDSLNNQKHYLDSRVKDIVEGEYNPVKARNNELRDRLSEAKTAYKKLIEQTVQKYEKLRHAHMDMYDREFAFKLNGDQNLVKSTLSNGVPFLQERNKRADAKLNSLKNKGLNAAETLQNEIKALESELKFYQK